MTKRALCLDVGERRIGVAVSDLLGITAQGVETIESRGVEKDLARVRELAAQYGVAAIVCGLPRNMDGSEGFQAARVRSVGDRLSDEGYRVIYQDERLTTASARKVLIEADVRRGKRKDVIDKMAAGLILQVFIDGGGLSRL